MKQQDISRRSFLKLLGGGALASAAVLSGCKSRKDIKAVSEYTKQVEPPVGKMTYRINPKTKEKSLPAWLWYDAAAVEDREPGRLRPGDDQQTGRLCH